MARQIQAQKLNKITRATRALSDLAHELGPGAKMPTVAELRSRAGVSVVTLNEALSQAEALHLIDRKHGVGIYVSQTLRKGVAMVCAPRFFREASASPFWQLLVEHTEKRAAAKNEAFSFHFEPSLHDDDSPDRLEQSSFGRAIVARQVQGVIGVGLEEETLAWLEDQQIPVVTYAASGRCRVSFDTAWGVHTATLELLRGGCTHLELWLPPQEHPPLLTLENEHSEAFKRALQLTEGVRGRVREATATPGKTKQEQGFEMAYQMFDRDASHEQMQELPDGIVFSNDLMAHGALVALAKLGLKPGRDLQIATHANAGSPVLLGYEELLLIEVDPAELVTTMFNLLENLMSASSSLHQSMQVTLAPRLRTAGKMALSD